MKLAHELTRELSFPNRTRWKHFSVTQQSGKVLQGTPFNQLLPNLSRTQTPPYATDGKNAIGNDSDIMMHAKQWRQFATILKRIPPTPSPSELIATSDYTMLTHASLLRQRQKMIVVRGPAENQGRPLDTSEPLRQESSVRTSTVR
jgi:hypothetical protein